MEALIITTKEGKDEKLQMKKEKEFWRRLYSIVSPDQLRIWEVSIKWISPNFSHILLLWQVFIAKVWKYIQIDKMFSIQFQMLEKELEKYHQALQERANLLRENEEIRSQNNEFKGLLNQYMNSKINEDLMVPPITRA